MIVLTHEGARPAEKEPYLAAKWHPMPVVCLSGRSASAESSLKNHTAVFYSWKDMGCTQKKKLQEVDAETT